MSHSRLVYALCAGATLGLAALDFARADDHARWPRDTPPAYAQECGACHVALPPGLLPARSWQRLMAGLGQHYGVDASLDAATLQPLAAWLQANAGSGRRMREEPPQDRITRSSWFEHEHRQIDAAVWQMPSVKTAVNCAACHVGAEQGRFDDDALRQPAGLDARSRRAWNH